MLNPPNPTKIEDSINLWGRGIGIRANLLSPVVTSSIPDSVEFVISVGKIGNRCFDNIESICVCSRNAPIIENRTINPPIVSTVSIAFFMELFKVLPKSDNFSTCSFIIDLGLYVVFLFLIIDIIIPTIIAER